MTIIKPERFKLVTTVALVLIDKDNVLLLRRSGTGYFDNHYALVAGCVDGNETVTEAIIREAQEEANIILQPAWLTMASVMHRKTPQRANEKSDSSEAIDFFFISSKWDGDIKNNEPHKHDDMRFFPIHQLPQPMLPFQQAGLENALRGIPFGTHGW